MLITAEGISYSAGAKQILHNVSLTVRPKKFVGVIGPNGSGKSTFLKCVYRTLRADKGTIYFDGVNLADLSYRESALKLAVVAQHNFYSFDFSVQEVVLMGRSPHKNILEGDNAYDYELVRACLAKVNMEDFAERSFNTLSGGEQQRVILARALAQATECLVLDEPTNHLDIKYQLQLLDTVKSLDLTVVAAIHDLNIAVMYCDYLVAIKDGRIVGSGTPQELLTEQFIYALYEVRSKVYPAMDGAPPHIVYLPRHLHK